MGWVNGWTRQTRINFMDWQQALGVAARSSTCKVDHLFNGCATNALTIFAKGIKCQVVKIRCCVVDNWKDCF